MEVFRRRKPRRQDEHFPRQKRFQERHEQISRQRDFNEADTYLPNYQETLVHYHKSFGVLQELFDHRDFIGFAEEIHGCAAIETGPRFLDLGCAPGGFAACLLQDHILGPVSVGYGVSLPPQLGGFQMAITSSRLYVQFQDLLQINSCELMCIDDSIDICVADAQYLSNMFKPQHQASKYRGMKTRSRTLGIWALTVKECQIAFAKLRQSGSFIFRFGWRGVGSADVHPSGEPVHPSLLAKYLQEEEWYTALTHWLFSVLKSLFSTLRPFKSEYVHQADVSFYMVCRNFDREKFKLHDWEVKLQRAYDELTNCEDEAKLVAGLKEAINQGIKAEIDELLEYVGRMRAIGIQSRKVTKPQAFTWKSDAEQKEETTETTSKEEKVSDTDEKAERGKEAKEAVVKSDASTELEERSESSSATTLPSRSADPAEPGEAFAARARVEVPKPPGRCTSQPLQRQQRARLGKGERPSGRRRSDWISWPSPSPTTSTDAIAPHHAGIVDRTPWETGTSGTTQWHSWDASDYEQNAWNFITPEASYSTEMLPKLPMDLDASCGSSAAAHGFDAMYQVEHMDLHLGDASMFEDPMNGHTDVMMLEDSMDSMLVQDGSMSADAMMQADTFGMWCNQVHTVHTGQMANWVQPTYGALPECLPPPPPAPPVLRTTEVISYPPPPQGLLSMPTPAVSSTPQVVPSPPEGDASESAPCVPELEQTEQLSGAPEQEAFDALASEDEDLVLRRRRRRKDRDERHDRDRRREHRGKKDRSVLRAIRLMHREGKGYRPPWYRRFKDIIRSAVLDIHQDSLNALRFGICFAMAWSLCSLIMSMIRFSSQLKASNVGS